MYNGEYISRVLDVYQKGSTNKESVLRVLKDIPLTTNEADNYKIISITDNCFSVTLFAFSFASIL